MGKVLSISIQGRELSRIPLTKNSLTIGRSPLCDVTLRSPGIKSVHYLLDWALDGEFNPDLKNQEWSLIEVSDVSSDSKDVKKSTSGLGQIVSENPIDIGRFTFKIIEDRLQSARLEGSLIQRSLLKMKEKNLSSIPILENRLMLEVIRGALDTGGVTEVAHIDYKKEGVSFFPIKALPFLEVIWINFEQIIIRLNDDRAQINVTQWASNRLLDQNIQSEYYLDRGGFIQIDTSENEYYFRLVPKVEVPIIQAEWKQDKFFWLFLFLMILSFGFLQAIHQLYKPSSPKEIIPPRIAKVELYQPKKEISPPAPVLPPPPPPKKIEPKEEPKVQSFEPKAPTTTTSPSVKPPKLETARPSVTKKMVPEKPRPIPPSGPKSAKPVPSDKPVEAVGLLAAMGSQRQKSNAIRAESVLSGRDSSGSISGKEETLVIKQPSVGALGVKTKPSEGVEEGGPSSLAKASSQVGNSDSIKAASLKGISGGSGSGIDVQFGEYSDVSGESNGRSKIGNLNGEESIEGGLNKDAVRRTLASHRSDIKTCYERALTVQKKLKGRIVYKWLISPKGPTIWVNLARSELNSPRLETCIRDVISRIVWPIAANKKETIVNYPFEFHSKD